MTRCEGRQRDGRRCGAFPIRGERYCLLHSPTRREDAAAARRLGGLRRRRVKALPVVELEGLASVAGLRRILEIIARDTIALDNGIARSRTLIQLVGVAARLLELDQEQAILGVRELAARIAEAEGIDPDELIRGAEEIQSKYGRPDWR